MIAEITDDVYDVTIQTRDEHRWRHRVYVFDVDVPTLVDTGYEETTETLFEELENANLRPERVVVTHGHGDHIGGYEEVVQRYEPETWLSVQTQEKTGLSSNNQYDHEEEVGNFTAVHISGHDVDTYALVDEDLGVAVMGDVLAGSDNRGLPAGYFHLPSAHVTNDLNEAENNLKSLLEYEYEVGLVFHGKNVTEDASEKVEKYIPNLG